MREQGGESYLTLAEVQKQYGWKPGTVYYFRERELLELYQFTGDKRSYCKVSELEAIRNRPPEVKKRGPKDHALKEIPVTASKLGRARHLVGIGGRAPAPTL